MPMVLMASTCTVVQLAIPQARFMMPTVAAAPDRCASSPATFVKGRTDFHPAPGVFNTRQLEFARVDSNIPVSGNAKGSPHCNAELMVLRVVLCVA